MISRIIDSLLNHRKIALNELPSQGLFYKNDFNIRIKKADNQHIFEYELNYRHSVESVIHRVKRVVKKNVILPKGYNYFDLKSIDILFIFFEIVKFTNDRDIIVPYFDEIEGYDFITFDTDHFNYFQITDEVMKYYDMESREFVIDGFRYSVPSIGVEVALTKFLVEKTRVIGNEHYTDYIYSFIYFLNHKSSILPEEIENLIKIFNDDISNEDKEVISGIISLFQPMESYTLKKDDQIINITSKINLENIWRD